ncbi:hypothetical protein EA82_00770 [Enterococcus hirae]|nr:hypothetical protein A5813_001073 [Enterococcus faecium]OTO59179.1 hypothetical protein A5812_002183 [Enterococcus faecium]RBT70861.1 hypothetical protein EA82_00770 [Enterococcus hirae]
MNDFSTALDNWITTPDNGVPQYEAPIDEEDEDESF